MSSEPDKFADGDQRRDFIYVKDAAWMTCDFLENGLTGIYNIGMGKTTTWNEIAEYMFAALDKPCNIEYFERVEIRAFSKDYPGFIATRDAGEFSLDTEVSYIKLRFFRENKAVKTIRMKETDRDVDYCITSLKHHLEKIDLLKY